MQGFFLFFFLPINSRIFFVHYFVVISVFFFSFQQRTDVRLSEMLEVGLCRLLYLVAILNHLLVLLILSLLPLSYEQYMMGLCGGIVYFFLFSGLTF